MFNEAAKAELALERHLPSQCWLCCRWCRTFQRHARLLTAWGFAVSEGPCKRSKLELELQHGCLLLIGFQGVCHEYATGITESCGVQGIGIHCPGVSAAIHVKPPRKLQEQISIAQVAFAASRH